MAQFSALIWLKWTVFRNSLRSRKAMLSQVASILGTMAAVLVALLIALILGVTAYRMLSPGAAQEILAQLPPDHAYASEMRKLMLSGFQLLFIVFAILYLMWATVPLSLGGGSQFTPGRLLLYPVSLKKLFAIDFLSELGSLGSIFAIPIILAVSLGAGLGLGNLPAALPVALLALCCGISLAKWLQTAMSSLMQKRRTRGETVLALIGVVVGLGGAFMGELAAYMARPGVELRGLRWTPPGAAAVALTEGLRAGGGRVYATALVVLAGYTVALIFVTYLIARRAALGAGGAKRASAAPARTRGEEAVAHTGWHLPFVSPQISAVVEKELRYAMRNAQLRMMAVMPLILIVVRMLRGGRPGAAAATSLRDLPVTSFVAYTEGLLVAAGVLYVFLILSSLACNLFAYDGGGMRSFILAPVARRTILLGKNLTICFLAFVFCAVLLAVNQLVFRDLSLPALGVAALSFVFFAACFSVIGNLLSIRFPKRLQFGKRMNASGVTGFLLIPIMLALASPVFLAVFFGYLAQSLTVKYATLALFAALAVALYGLSISGQARSLARREQEILDAVSGRTED
ncbi:MAG TPA: hypothetical protein VJ715_12115 [Pyrinomonadaceae bacterium]|nr:hypothetical protein [Pyrinomonadaceae bacterium]